MVLKNSWLLFLIILFVGACSEAKNTRYKDTSVLESPPVMDIVEKPKAVVKETEKIENTGLGDVVKLVGSDEQPVIQIKKIFDRSWDIVGEGLKLSEIEISDKNREEGVYYLRFDPDNRSSKDSGLMDSMAFLFFADDYDEAPYKLTVIWKDSSTEVTAELVDEQSDDFLDDGKGDFDGSVDSGAKLIKALYKTIRDDLPND
mgnify:FL=1